MAVGADRELEVRAEGSARMLLLVRVMTEVLGLMVWGVDLSVASLVLLE